MSRKSRLALIHAIAQRRQRQRLIQRALLNDDPKNAELRSSPDPCEEPDDADTRDARRFCSHLRG